jgi:hypothetical protein
MSQATMDKAWRGGWMGPTRNLILCSDGTGNTFDNAVTNVTRLVSCLEAQRPDRQLIFYDQGVGTTARRAQKVAGVRAGAVRAAPSGALHMLPAPPASRGGPLAWVRRGRGLMFGYGLKDNVGQLYGELARHYIPGDAVFLFGFSRGAFTVRALAGLLHRCHLPAGDTADLDDRFERSWQVYQPMQADIEAVRALRAEHRPCPIHFLGLWDTVKSYGGLDPVILPHLRHNPDVACLRHALALDEQRAWFKPTTWGQLDSDRNAAMTRLDPEDVPAYQRQDIKEVWFTGCHSDIGGGDRQAETARITLRWMLAEAATMMPGVLLNDAGSALLQASDPTPTIHQSWTPAWRAVEQVPREEIDNSGVYPVKVRRRGSDGERDLRQALRDGHVDIHTSARDSPWPVPVRRVATKPPPATASS